MRTLRIGTRRSALALAQTEEVRSALGAAGIETEVVPLVTTGDEGVPAQKPADGLKGLWIDAILEALREGTIDLAVHSAKDLPAEDADDLPIAAVPRRADPRDVLILREPGSLQPGMVVGTSSIRRRAQLLAAHPGITVTALRGNVDTRLRKLAEGEVDAAVLAAAGLARLALEPENATAIGVDEMLPAPGQGALAVQCRADARDVRAALAALDHRPSRLAVEAERALTRALGGGCALPLGAMAAVKADTVRLAGRVIGPLGDRRIDAAAEAADPGVAATMVAAQLRAAGAAQILDEVRGS